MRKWRAKRPGRTASDTSREERHRFKTEIRVSGRGTGYVTLGRDEPVRIEAGLLNTALDGDTVEVIIWPRRGTAVRKGEVARVIRRAKNHFVGVVDKNNNSHFLIPDDRRIYTTIMIPNGKLHSACAGEKAFVKLLGWDDPRSAPIGEVVKVLGKRGDIDVEMNSIILGSGFLSTFPLAVEREASEIKMRESERDRFLEEVSRRRDFRGIPTFTIDPKDAKDFDDAISLRKLREGEFEVGIHIADVSHYVREGSELDREARKRGFSIYLVDRTVPMLPEALSNDLCSLNPNEEKLTFSAVFIISEKERSHFEITSRWFGRTVIKSIKRFTYEEAELLLDSRKAELSEELKILNRMAESFRTQKLKLGAIDFEEEEVGFVLSLDGEPVRIFKKKRLKSHKLVEEFMLLANREVAAEVFRRGAKRKFLLPFIYRVHDAPDPERIDDLRAYLKALGHELPHGSRGKITGQTLQALFERIVGKDYESLVRSAALRAMAKAAYSTGNIGHFALAFKHYTHFTSPIRRYPDLIVHRLLEKYLRTNLSLSQEEIARYERIAREASELEIAVAEAERASIKYMQIRYMMKQKSRLREGVISGLSEWGIYIEDLETKAEGMVRLRDLTDDYYILDEKNYCLVGERTKKRYSLGGRVNFRVVGADPDRKTLDYVLV